MPNQGLGPQAGTDSKDTEKLVALAEITVHSRPDAFYCPLVLRVKPNSIEHSILGMKR